MIQGNQPPFGNGLARIRKQLPQYADGAFRLLINLPRFFDAFESLLPRTALRDEKALGVAKNAGERTTQFVRHAADHLPERGELFGLQELRLKNALRREVAVNFHAAHVASDAVEDRPRGPLEHPGEGKGHLQGLAHAALDVAGQFTPALGKLRRFHGLMRKARNPFLESLKLPGFLGSQPGHLLESRVYRAHVFVRIKQHHSFLDPLDDILQFGFSMIR